MHDSWASYGAAAGAGAVILFAIGAALAGTEPDFNAPAGEVVSYFQDDRTRIQVGCAFFAAAMPFFVWFLATVSSLAREGGAGAGRAGAVAYGCGLLVAALFLADVTALAVGALRPDNMADSPEVAVALLDFSFLAMGMAAFVVAGMFAAFAVVVLRHAAVWPNWLGWMAALAAVLYSLRLGTLFTTDGPFASDGVLGLYVPVAAWATWIFLASVMLARDLRSTDGG